MQLRQLISALTLCLCLSFNSLCSQSQQQTKEYLASDLIDADHLALVADSFNIPHPIFYAIAWQETRRGDFNYRFPRGPGKFVFDHCTGGPECPFRITKRICREVGRFQLNPCIDWSRILHDPLCTNANILSKDKYFAYLVDVHCAAEQIANLHTGYSWMETIRRYNGQGNISYKYLDSVLAYLGRFYIRLSEWE